MVLTASRRYPSVFQIQMAVTACLYNLTHEVSQKLHPHLLNEIVQSNLDAMEVFPQHHQMQKNCLLTMCSDRIINDVNFDRLRCAKLALNCLNEFQDGAMNRMSVAIISMLGMFISLITYWYFIGNKNFHFQLLVLPRLKPPNLDLI